MTRIHYNWNLKITKKEAFKFQELVSLFEAQEFRIMANRILKQEISNEISILSNSTIPIVLINKPLAIPPTYINTLW